MSLFFFTNGALFATLLPRYPQIKDAFGLNNTEFGFMVAALPLGSLIASALPAPIIRRFGAAAVALVGTALLACALVVAGFSTHVAVFAVAIMLGGALDAVVDAAQNVHGLRVQRWLRRSIINSLHALWSIGAALGGAIGAAAAAAQVPLGVHLLVSGVVWTLVIGVGAALSRVPGDLATTGAPEDHAPPTRHGPWLALVPLVLLAISGILVEDVANNWSTLYLHVQLGAPLGFAGLGLVTMLVSQFVGRLLGDPMTDRWGVVPVARAGGLTVALGMATVVLAPATPLAFVGFALAGFGCATLVPVAFAGAEAIPGFREGTAVTMVGWLMRLGFLGTSPLVGAIADRAGLQAGLLVPVVAGLAAAVVAGRIRRPT